MNLASMGVLCIFGNRALWEEVCFAHLFQGHIFAIFDVSFNMFLLLLLCV